MKKSISLILCLCLLLAVLPAGALAAKPVYLALGDSIPAGAGLESADQSFAAIVAETMGYELVNLGVNGNTAAAIRAQVESGAIDDRIASAQLITLTCGGNDMLALVYAKAVEAYNASYDPDITVGDVTTILGNSQDPRFLKLAMAANGALTGNEAAGIPPYVESPEFFAAVSEYAGHIDTISYHIRKVNPDAILIITTQYNPYKSFSGMLAGLAAQLDMGIQALNGPITHPDSGHTYADVYAAFAQRDEQLCNASPNPLNLDFHPNAAGHKVIAETILDMLEIPAPVNPFEDVPEGIYYHDPVMWALDKGVTTCTDETHFSPYANTQRCQIVTFLWRAYGEPEPTATENPFVDVKESDYFYKPVLWALEKGITTGTDETHFSPFAECQRGQVVTFLWRAEGKPEPTTTENPFVDVNESQYFYKAVLWAVENGITSGAGDGGFAPFAITQRCQAVTFLYRALNKN